MTAIRRLAALAVLAICCATVGQTQEKKIAMIRVKYDGLKQEVAMQRGNVLVVDFWAGYCPPCKAKFPHFIDMQKKFADKGLVVITVSVDEAGNEEHVEIANRFLNKVNSPFRNLLLDEPIDVWSRKLDMKSVPCYYVFDRHGKWVRYRASDYQDGADYYDDMEKTIVRMLNEK